MCHCQECQHRTGAVIGNQAAQGLLELRLPGHGADIGSRSSSAAADLGTGPVRAISAPDSIGSADAVAGLKRPSESSGMRIDLASRRPTELPQDGRDEVLQHRAVARADDLDRLRQACATTTELTPTSERNRSML